MADQVFTRKTGFSLQVETEARGITNIVDEPEFNGGADSGITPVELELAALGADLQRIAEDLSSTTNYSYEKLSINIEGDIDLDGLHGNPNIPNGFQKIRLYFLFKTKMSQEDMDEFAKRIIANSEIYSLINNVTVVNNQVSKEN
ncbi:OsmC family protein [Lactobacillus sp. PSON]|uniref:OsmC family protein n=1 Tax=Lactobacillus sp. PSON TaxID=3455454 RepID=UPI0040439336